MELSLSTDLQSMACYSITAAAAAAAAAKSLQSCLILCDPRDGTPPGSAVPGILQARILEWVAISFSNFVQTSFREFGEVGLGTYT